MDSWLSLLFPNEFFRHLIESFMLALWGALVDWWWLVLPAVLFPIARDYWEEYKKEQLLNKVEWVMVELRIPQEIETTPKTMEQIFSSLAAATTPLPIGISFEMVGQYKQGVSFFIRMPKEFQRLIETQIYSQYPQVEISLVEDYLKRFKSLPDNYYDLWGAELTLTDEAIYPIKTYPQFEEFKEERRLDPLAPFLEILSQLREGEEIWFQLVVRNLTKAQAKAWKEEAKKSIDKLIGKKAEEKKPSNLELVVSGLTEELKNVVNNFISDVGSSFHLATSGSSGEKKEEKKEDRPSLIQFLTPGEKEKVEKVEEKLSKTAFEVAIRVAYLAPKTVVDKKSYANSIKSYFRTFNQAHLNGFKEKSKEYPFYLEWFFSKNLEFRDTNKFFKACVNRLMDDPEAEGILKKLVLNTEELATLYHFPLTIVGAPRLYRLQTKKFEPPPNLPVF